LSSYTVTRPFFESFQSANADARPVSGHPATRSAPAAPAGSGNNPNLAN
jgi:hypothetical protein